MKTIYQYILLLSLVLLASCSDENWFIHSVKYNNKVDKPEMVVTATLEAGKTPVIYVNESVFFLDPNHEEEDTIWRTREAYDYDDNYYYYYTRHVKSGFLRDAEVLMSVNGAEPIRLVGAERMDTLPLLYYDSTLAPDMQVRKSFAYSSDYILQPGDQIELTVSHANYKQPAKVSQQIPFPLTMDLQNLTIDMSNKETSFASISLRLAPYKGQPSDMLSFRAITYQHAEHHYTDWYVDYQSVDTTIFSYNQYGFIYSQDLSFVGYDKTNKQLSSGYYGAGYYGLFRAANTQEEQLSFTFPVDLYSSEGESSSTHAFLDSVVITVQTVTRDNYLYNASMVAAGYRSFYIPDYFGGETGGNIFDEIQEIFDEMGSMEGVQLYSNVENAIGHVTATTATSITIRPNQ